MKNNYPKRFKYENFAKMWKAEHFNPDYFATIVKASGAKYFILTTKHHDGFTLWPSKYSKKWNSVDIGPKKDLVSYY